MACLNSYCYSCYGPYYPCPATTSYENCSSNNVVSSGAMSNFSYLTLTTTTSVEQNGIVPVKVSTVQGTSITESNSEITLETGIYEVSYVVNSQIGANGENAFVLNFNGTNLTNSLSTAQGTVGNQVNMTGTTVVTVQTTGVIYLVNASGNSVNVTSANVFVKKL